MMLAWGLKAFALIVILGMLGAGYTSVKNTGIAQGRSVQKAADEVLLDQMRTSVEVELKARDTSIGELQAAISTQNQRLAQAAAEARARVADAEARRRVAETSAKLAEDKAARILALQPQGDVCTATCSLLHSD